MKTVRPGWTVD